MALLTIVADGDELAERVADRFTALANEALRTRGVAAICLTGGRTPRQTYELLASDAWQARTAWDRVDLFWSDERHVPPDHPDSNFGMARDALVMRVPIPASHVHRIRGELAPDEAARLYERELPERFDLVLLGLGEDGHIASIFPASPAIEEQRRRAMEVWAPHLKTYRITLTPPPLLESRHILMIAAGAAKASAVTTAIDGPPNAQRCPAHLLRTAGGRVEWFIDRAAGRGVSSPHG